MDLLVEDPRLTIYLLSKKHRVPKYIYTKPPTYKSPIGGNNYGHWNWTG